MNLATMPRLHLRGTLVSENQIRFNFILSHHLEAFLVTVLIAIWVVKQKNIELSSKKSQ